MRALKLMSFVALLLTLSTSVSAQSRKDELAKDWERAKAYTKEFLDAMPESAYGLKPAPDMRSFADQMLHLSDANYGIAAASLGVESPVKAGSLEKSADKTKASVSKAVLDSYDFVINSLKEATDQELNERVKLFGKFDLTKGAGLSKSFEHQTHHRGQTVVYLRLAGLKPPAEKLF